MNQTTLHAPQAPDGAAECREFLIFRLGEEQYGIHILKVQEIRGYERPTTIANAPPFIKGVMNLRGVIVPVLDLRVRFDLPVTYDESTVVIVLTVADRVVGVVVDAVSDVRPLAGGDIQPPPEFADSVFDSSYITGLATVDDRMLILLDIEKLITGADMTLVEERVL